MPRPLLILDLDETLLHARETELPRAHDFRIAHYFVYARPHLAAFLAAAASSYDLAVWTSASQPYADLAVQQLFKHVLPLQFIWSARRCTRRFDRELMINYDVKDLRKAKRRGYPLERVLMIDDTPEKLERHYGNHILIPPFLGDPTDAELPALATYLLRIADHHNFRKLEKRNWRSLH